MRIISSLSETDCLCLSMGVEEAMILFQPGEMLRATLERNRAWVVKARFLTRMGEGAAEGMLAILPRAVAPALLSAAAGHPVERELQEIFFSVLTPAERPRLPPEDPP
jgi:hypothetical protein